MDPIIELERIQSRRIRTGDVAKRRDLAKETARLGDQARALEERARLGARARVFAGAVAMLMPGAR
jgi:hypothetical protein